MYHSKNRVSKFTKHVEYYHIGLEKFTLLHLMAILLLLYIQLCLYTINNSEEKQKYKKVY